MSDGWIRTERGWLKRADKPAPPAASSSFPCPLIASDAMPPTEHVDGKLYDSKAAFRAVTKAHGLTEVGNEKLPTAKPAKADPAARRASVRKAMSQAGL